MRILLEDYVLADHGVSSVADFRLAVNGVVQEEPILRAAAPKLFHRGNVASTLTFSVSREHETLEDAQLFLLDFGGKCPTNGVLTVQVEKENQGESVRWADAVLVAIQPLVFRGVSTVHGVTLRTVNWRSKK